MNIRKVRKVGKVKNSAVMLLLGVLAIVPMPAAAQTVPPQAPAAPAPPPMVQKLFRADSKVGFVDLQRIFNESAYGKQGIAKIGALQKTLSDGLSARTREMQVLSDKIKTQQNIVAPVVWLEWNSDLQRMQRKRPICRWNNSSSGCSPTLRPWSVP